MIIDPHTINTLRTLAQQCAQDDYTSAGVEPAILLALLGAFEERDEIATDYETEHYHRLAVERDRDALAAHLEIIKKAIEECPPRCASGVSNLAVNEKAYIAVTKAANESPATSLARHDLIKQAEALELVKFQSGPHEDTPKEDDFDAGWDAAFELLGQRAAELRQQAEATK